MVIFGQQYRGPEIDVCTASEKSYEKTDSTVESGMKFLTKYIYSGLFNTFCRLRFRPVFALQKTEKMRI